MILSFYKLLKNYNVIKLINLVLIVLLKNKNDSFHPKNKIKTIVV